MADATTYTLIPQSNIQQVLEINRVVKTCQSEMALAESTGDDMVKTMIAAAAMNKLRSLLTDQVMTDVMQLVGSPLGISVENNAKWEMPIVRDVVLAGLLQGARIVGGEMHIASGKLYLRKEYWERRFKEYPGVTDVKPPDLGLPRYQRLVDKDYATVQCKLTYRLNGKLQVLDRTGDSAITVLCNAGMKLDAIHGKVKKRLYQTAYAVVSGQHVMDDEDGTIEGTILEPTTSHQPAEDAEFEPKLPENPGDDIAADAAQALADQTPPVEQASPVERPKMDKAKALEAMRKKPKKTVGAWVAHCASQGVDISAEADEYLRSA